LDRLTRKILKISSPPFRSSAPVVPLAREFAVSPPQFEPETRQPPSLRQRAPVGRLKWPARRSLGACESHLGRRRSRGKWRRVIDDEILPSLLIKQMTGDSDPTSRGMLTKHGDDSAIVRFISLAFSQHFERRSFPSRTLENRPRKKRKARGNRFVGSVYFLVRNLGSDDSDRPSRSSEMTEKVRRHCRSP
jgi:hypothetical protein